MTVEIHPTRLARSASRKHEVIRQRGCVDAIWTRAKSQCEECGRPVERPGLSKDDAETGYVRFFDPQNIQVETGNLLCALHFHGILVRRG